MNNSKRILKIFLVFILISLLAGCRISESPDTKQSESDAKQNDPDYWPTAGWRTSTPEEQGMDSEVLAEMVEFIIERNYDIHSVTIIRNGYMVADVTVHPFESNSMHNLASASKSIKSALIGIAINQGYIESVQQPVLSFFPERSAANLDDNKENMTLEHLLTMSSGLDCRDNINGWIRLIQMVETDDWVQYMLDLPMAKPPGSRFEYCNGNAFLHSAIIQETTGVHTLDFAEENLFGPLGIDDVIWPSNPRGISSFDIYMKPHDMAKIGYLYLNEGRWEESQIISPDWVAASSHKHSFSPGGYGYGYQWWIRNNGIYHAAGRGFQHIFVIPEHEMVVVFTGNMGGGYSVISNLLDNILSAVKSSKPLPSNPAGVELLKSKIQLASLEQAKPEPIPPLPEIAHIISGHTYILDYNPFPFGLKSVSLTFPNDSEVFLDLTYNLDEFQIFTDNPQNLWTEMERPVGLDNVYRYSPGFHGITMGMKGKWVSDDTFEIDVDNIGYIGHDYYRLTFIDGMITLVANTDFSGITTIYGRLEE